MEADIGTLGLVAPPAAVWKPGSRVALSRPIELPETAL